MYVRVCDNFAALRRDHRRNLRRVRGVPPLFGLRGTVPLTFRDKNMKNLLSQCCQQRRSAEIKLNRFGRGSALDPAGRAHDVLTDPRVRWGGGYLLPVLFPSPRDPRAPRSLSELVPPTF